MGENANASWAWHNTVVGEGYQAKGVVRQRGVGVTAPARLQVVDLSKEITHSNNDKPGGT